MKSPDEKVPFTCKITNEYCGGRINNLILDLYKDGYELYPKNIFTIPLSPDVAEKIDKKMIRKIQQFVIRELKLNI